MFAMTNRVVLDNYQLRIGELVRYKHHDDTGVCIIVDYGSDPDTYVLKRLDTGTECCYHIDKLSVL